MQNSSSTASDPDSAPAAGVGSKLDVVLRLLTKQGHVSSKTRQSAQGALAATPANEAVLDAWRCGVKAGVANGEGVAVLTADRLAVFERRGFRSLDQRFQLVLARPFSVEVAGNSTCLRLSFAGGRPVAIDFLDPDRAEALRLQLERRQLAHEVGMVVEPVDRLARLARERGVVELPRWSRRVAQGRAGRARRRRPTGHRRGQRRR